ncbi:MAG: BamA/TamA family outer membrane protein [Planctomycetota bacterium]
MRRLVPLVLLALAAACRSGGVAEEMLADTELAFDGNESIPRAHLIEVAVEHLRDFRDRGHGKAAIDDAAYRIEQHYRDLGYAYAEVSYAVEEPVTPASRVSITISEGPRVVLHRLRITGGKALGKDRIRALAEGATGKPGEATFSERALDAAVAAILEDARAAGFRDASVEIASSEVDADTGHADVTIEIETGLRYRLRAVEIRGETPVAEKRLQSLVREERGAPYTPRLAATVLSRLEEELRESGYPEARAEIADIRTGEGDVRLAVALAPGEHVRVTAVRFEAVRGVDEEDDDDEPELATRRGTLRNLVTIRAGRPFNAAEARESFQKLYSTGFFSRVRWRFEPPTGPEREVIWELAELDSIEVWIEPGVGSYDGLRLRAGLRERSLLGSLLALRAQGTISSRTLRGEVGLTDPRFLGSDLVLDLSVDSTRREEPSFEYIETAFETSLSRRWNKRFGSELAYRFQLSELLSDEIDEDSLSSEELEDLEAILLDSFDVASLQLASLYDTRDNLLNPSSGYRVEASIEWANEALGSDLDFLRGIASATYVHRIKRGLILSGHASAGRVIPQGDTEEIPLQERFFLGGENSVRSFRESELGPKDPDGEPLGGEEYALFSAELRKDLPRNFEVALFADTGSIDGFRHAVGVGLRYDLPVGPLRLDFGVNPNPEDGEDDFALHFAVGRAY